MIAEIAAATLLTWGMVQAPPQSDDPLKSALNYHSYLDRYIERLEAKEARQQERQERREARQQERAEERALEVETTSRSSSRNAMSGSLPELLAFIRSQESGGNYSAYNGSGCEGYGCYGAYQMHGAYMDDWARSYGAASYASTPANQWPPAVQDQVALGLYYSTNPDGAHWCNWTDYC